MNSLQTMSTTPSIAAQQRYWDQRWHRQSEPNRWQSRRSDTVLAFARELPLDNPRALDLGCGTGFTTSALSDFGTAEGIDLSPKAIEIARLPLKIRGFGHVKQKSVDQSRALRETLLRKFAGKEMAVEVYSP